MTSIIQSPKNLPRPPEQDLVMFRTSLFALDVNCDIHILYERPHSDLSLQVKSFISDLPDDYNCIEPARLAAFRDYLKSFANICDGSIPDVISQDIKIAVLGIKTAFPDLPTEPQTITGRLIDFRRTPYQGIMQPGYYIDANTYEHQYTNAKNFHGLVFDRRLADRLSPKFGQIITVTGYKTSDKEPGTFIFTSLAE